MGNLLDSILNARSTFLTGLPYTDSEETLTFEDADQFEENFQAERQFHLVVYDLKMGSASDALQAGRFEIINAKSATGNDVSVDRGAEGTTPIEFDADGIWKVILAPTKGLFAELVSISDFDNADSEATFADSDTLFKQVSGVWKKFTWENLKDAILDFIPIEKGTFTPIYSPSSGSFASITYGTRVGRYVRLFDLVFCLVEISTNELDTTGASGDLRVGAFPFTSRNIGGLNFQGGAITRQQNFGSGSPRIAVMRRNESAANIQASPDGFDPVNVSDMQTGSSSGANRVLFTIMYKIQL